ncbi:hypothetical protein ETU10_06135 [Apibacter muscae]|uniref:hypothetical protein n=1 Tax=Apibacter muscae TaxID=2509004 RepID=UPI0011AD00FE|nr:hypothetical protein [Apibacter muscae]TWP23810.1 hypothetical protein ETU10_06135 [Apibacter muscae]
MNSKIVESTEKLAKDNIIMNSYKDFYGGKGYFLTKNLLLGGSKKPFFFPIKSSFEKWWSSGELNIAQKKYILLLSGVNEYNVNKNAYDSIKKGYDKWNSNYLVVVYGGNKGWACNFFVGEALFFAGINTVVSGKYLSAKQIWNGESSRMKLIDKKNLLAGDIAAFGGTHVEIVIRVHRGQLFFDDDFCSRGAGRGATDFGTEKCEGMFGDTREIENSNIRFLRAQ